MNKPNIPQMANDAVDTTGSMMIMAYRDFESQLYKEFAKNVIRDAVKFLKDNQQPLDDALKQLEKRYA